MIKAKWLSVAGVFFVFLPAVMNCVQAALLTYGFDNGTIISNGWTEVSNSSANPASFKVVYGATLEYITPHAGAGCLAQKPDPMVDASGSTLWLRSPEFKLNGDPAGLIAYLMGGSGDGAEATGLLVADVPANSSRAPFAVPFPSFLGIALRNVNTDVFDLATHRSFNAWGSWERIGFTAAQLAALDQNATYTLDFIDAYDNGWAWVHIDSVSIPGTLSSEPPVVLVVDAGPGFITWIGEPVFLNAAISGQASPTLTWSYEPTGGNVTFSNVGVEDPTVTFAAIGTYTLTLTANDGFNTPVSDTTIVNVYADACSAARDGANNRPATDIVADCITDLKDLAEIASNWLEDYALTAPAKVELRIPRVSKPWSESFRLVGGEYPLYSDFSLTKDALGQWHCIGTFGEVPATIGSGYELSDGYALFHAVGNSLEAPMTHLNKIPYQIDSPQAYMWAPGVIWNKDRTRAFLYYFHYFGGVDPVLDAQNACRLLISDSPDLSTWRPYDGTELSEINMVFREHLDRDFCVFWDDQLGKYLMYYCGLPGGPRVRTSIDLLHWSDSVMVLQAPLNDPHGYAESPFVLYRDGYYYLWVSGIDYSHTHLYISEDPFNFGDAIANSIEDTPGHAPEIVSENGIDYMACSMVSTVPSAYPAAYNLEGILIQPLRWDKPDAGMEARVTRKP